MKHGIPIANSTVCVASASPDRLDASIPNTITPTSSISVPAVTYLYVSFSFQSFVNQLKKIINNRLELFSQQCTPDEMADFPRRMRDWLFNVMRDLADRHDLSPHFLKLEREAEKDNSRRWANAAIWKFCDLDGHPHDR